MTDQELFSKTEKALSFFKKGVDILKSLPQNDSEYTESQLKYCDKKYLEFVAMFQEAV